jgi:hypothetical protein
MVSLHRFKWSILFHYRDYNKNKYFEFYKIDKAFKYII